MEVLLMLVKQISVFLENKSGRLFDVTSCLSSNDINIRALSIADTTDFGILRIIVNKPDKAEKVLKDEGFTVSSTEVIGIEIPDNPGGLSSALKILQESNISIEYLYAFVSSKKDKAYVILRVEEPCKASEVLNKKGVVVLKTNDIYEI
jgi:hypothetical protein